MPATRYDEFLVTMHETPNLCSHRDGDPLSQAGHKILLFFWPMHQCWQSHWGSLVKYEKYSEQSQQVLQPTHSRPEYHGPPVTAV